MDTLVDRSWEGRGSRRDLWRTARIRLPDAVATSAAINNDGFSE